MRPLLTMLVAVGCLSVLPACTTQTTYVKQGQLARVECTHLQVLLGEFTGPGYGVQRTVYEAAETQAKHVFESKGQRLCGVSQSQSVSAGSTHVLRVRSKGGSFNYSSQTTMLNVDLELLDIRANEVVWKGKSAFGYGNKFSDKTRLDMMQALLSPAFKMMGETGLIALSPT